MTTFLLSQSVSQSVSCLGRVSHVLEACIYTCSTVQYSTYSTVYVQYTAPIVLQCLRITLGRVSPASVLFLPSPDSPTFFPFLMSPMSLLSHSSSSPITHATHAHDAMVHSHDVMPWCLQYCAEETGPQASLESKPVELEVGTVSVSIVC